MVADLKDREIDIHYDRILAEYAALQLLYDAIVAVPSALQTITPVNYSDQLEATRQQGAADAYARGLGFLATDNSRAGKTKACNAFKNAMTFIPAYKDSKDKMEQAWLTSHVNVLLNPIKDNTSFTKNSIAGEKNMDIFYDNLQQQITTDLANKYGNKYNASFYTTQSRPGENIQPDWTVNIELKDLKVTGPLTVIANRDYNSTEIVGKDDKGKDIVSPIYGSVEKESESYIATGKLSITINDNADNKIISAVPLKILSRWSINRTSALGNRKIAAQSNVDPAVAYLWQTNYTFTDDETVLLNVYQKMYLDIQKVVVDAVSK